MRDILHRLDLGRADDLGAEMIRRFGRNQRRKLRDEITLRDKEIQRLEAVASLHWNAMLQERNRRQKVEREMADWAQRIVAVLGPDSAFVRELNTKDVDADMFELIAIGGRRLVVEPRQSLGGIGPTAEGEILKLAVTVIDTFAIYAETHIDDLACQVYFLIRSPKGDVALMMDHRTMYQLRSHGSAELGRHLLQKLIAPFMERGQDDTRRRPVRSAAGHCARQGRP